MFTSHANSKSACFLGWALLRLHFSYFINSSYWSHVLKTTFVYDIYFYQWLFYSVRIDLHVNWASVWMDWAIIMLIEPDIQLQPWILKILILRLLNTETVKMVIGPCQLILLITIAKNAWWCIAFFLHFCIWNYFEACFGIRSFFSIQILREINFNFTFAGGLCALSSILRKDWATSILTFFNGFVYIHWLLLVRQLFFQSGYSVYTIKKCCFTDHWIFWTDA